MGPPAHERRQSPWVSALAGSGIVAQVGVATGSPGAGLLNLNRRRFMRPIVGRAARGTSTSGRIVSARELLSRELLSREYRDHPLACPIWGARSRTTSGI